MKKKLLLGFSAVCLSAAFWACGDGSIESMGASDDAALGLYGYANEDGSSPMAGMVNDAMARCKEDPECVAAQTGADPLDVPPAEESSSEAAPASSATSAAGSATSSAATSAGSSAAVSAASSATSAASSATSAASSATSAASSATSSTSSSETGPSSSSAVSSEDNSSSSGQLEIPDLDDGSNYVVTVLDQFKIKSGKCIDVDVKFTFETDVFIRCGAQNGKRTITWNGELVTTDDQYNGFALKIGRTEGDDHAVRAQSICAETESGDPLQCNFSNW